MLKTIEVSREDMEEIINNLPDHLKDKLLEMVKPDSGIEYLRAFVEKYDDEDMFDHIVAHTLSNIFRRTADAVKHIIKDKKKAGEKDRINTVEMGLIVIEVLRKEAQNIEDALDEHEEKCDRGDKCDAKH